jgi:uncharacterized protein YidB (DUF937 family)
MGFLDSLRSAAGGFAGDEAHQAFGSVLQNTQLGGMSGLLDQLRQGGLGDQVSSWCEGAASNVAPEEIRGALGEEHVQAIASRLGISTDDVAQQLSEHLPAMAQAHAAATGDGGASAGA